MTLPPLPETVRLLPALVRFFAMEPTDVTALQSDLYAQAQAAWTDALVGIAGRYGCYRASPAGPSGSDAAFLQDMAYRDATSIASTWTADVTRELLRQFEAHPRSRRSDYLKVIQEWSGRRWEWKGKQIALQVEQKTRAYAQERFRQELANAGIDISEIQYVYFGPPPVSDICKARFAAGKVDKTFVDANPTPAHPGPCIHEWIEANATKVSCRNLWLG